MPAVLEAVSVADLDEFLNRAQTEGLFERLSDTYAGQCIFVKVDVDKSEEVASKYAVKAMPTFLMFKGNQKVDVLVGANLASLEAMIKKQVAPSASA